MDALYLPSKETTLGELITAIDSKVREVKQRYPFTAEQLEFWHGHVYAKVDALRNLKESITYLNESDGEKESDSEKPFERLKQKLGNIFEQLEHKKQQKLAQDTLKKDGLLEGMLALPNHSIMHDHLDLYAASALAHPPSWYHTPKELHQRLCYIGDMLDTVNSLDFSSEKFFEGHKERVLGELWHDKALAYTCLAEKEDKFNEHVQTAAKEAYDHLQKAKQLLVTLAENDAYNFEHVQYILGMSNDNPQIRFREEIEKRIADIIGKVKA